MTGRLLDVVSGALEDAVGALRDEDVDRARLVIKKKRNLDAIVGEILEHQERRFGEMEADRLEIFRTEMRFVEKMRRIFTFTKRVARTLSPKRTELVEENPSQES